MLAERDRKLISNFMDNRNLCRAGYGGTPPNSDESNLRYSFGVVSRTQNRKVGFYRLWERKFLRRRYSVTSQNLNACPDCATPKIMFGKKGVITMKRR